MPPSLHGMLVLQRELREFSYIPGEHHHFRIFEPKQHKMSAAPFRDRVVHHALWNLIEPVFDRRFIPDSYANRIGKGTHAAVDHLQELSQKHAHCL